jgi:hypothetical protein
MSNSSCTFCIYVLSLIVGLTAPIIDTIWQNGLTVYCKAETFSSFPGMHFRNVLNTVELTECAALIINV